MRHRPHFVLGERPHPHAALAEPLAEAAAAVPSRSSTRKMTMFVSTCGGSSARPSVSRTASAMSLRVGVVLGQALDVVLERVEGAGGDDAGLPHAAAERLCDGGGRGRSASSRADERRADRGAEALAEADADRVEVLGPLGGRNAAGDDGVEQPGAVEMPGQALALPPTRRSRRRRRTAARGRRRGCACSPGTPAA